MASTYDNWLTTAPEPKPCICKFDECDVCGFACRLHECDDFCEDHVARYVMLEPLYGLEAEEKLCCGDCERELDDCGRVIG